MSEPEETLPRATVQKIVKGQHGCDHELSAVASVLI